MICKLNCAVTAVQSSTVSESMATSGYKMPRTVLGFWKICSCSEMISINYPPSAPAQRLGKPYPGFWQWLWSLCWELLPPSVLPALSLDTGKAQTLWEAPLLGSLEGNRKMFVLLNCPVQSLSHTRHCCATNTLLMILLWHYKLFMEAIMSPQFFWFALVISPGWACHRHVQHFHPLPGTLFSVHVPRSVPHTITLLACITSAPLSKPPLRQSCHHQPCRAVNTVSSAGSQEFAFPPASSPYLGCVNYEIEHISKRTQALL